MNLNLRGTCAEIMNANAGMHTSDALFLKDVAYQTKLTDKRQVMAERPTCKFLRTVNGTMK